LLNLLIHSGKTMLDDFASLAIVLAAVAIGFALGWRGRRSSDSREIARLRKIIARLTSKRRDSSNPSTASPPAAGEGAAPL